MRFEGTVKPRRRGGWIARGVIIEERHGQIVETQIGPREFDDKAPSLNWLDEMARQRGCPDPAIASLGSR